MNLKDKLDRLPNRDASAGALEELRAKMQALIQPTVSEPRDEPLLPALDDLGLRLIENARGVVWQRREVLRPSRRVGRSTLLDARDARPEPLALLALDKALADVDLRRALYLDTETTGLGAGAGTFAFLIGLSYFEGEQAIFEQLFLEGPEQEPAALYELEQRLGDTELLVSFNGKAFDWPLLKGRFVYNRLPVPRDRPHLDLLHVARRVHGQRIGRCTLKDVEDRVLGYERSGDIEGALVAACYAHYLRSGDTSQLSLVIEHNAMDVWSLSALVGLYGEEVPDLDARDLASVSRTYRRAKAFERARDVASEAVERGGGAVALRARAEVNKALGDRLLALRDFESAEATESDPGSRLELVKLYEHYKKDPERALALLEQGTSESDEQTERRAARLSKKVNRARQGRSTGAKKPEIC